MQESTRVASLLLPSRAWYCTALFVTRSLRCHTLLLACRFVPTLRSDGVDVVLAVFKALCIMGGEAGLNWAGPQLGLWTVASALVVDTATAAAAREVAAC